MEKSNRRRRIIKSLQIEKLSLNYICWFDGDHMWEKDYITELFSDFNCRHIYLNKKNNLDLDKKILAFVINEDGLQNRESEYQKFITKYKPKILVHLSDEYLICKDLVSKLYPQFDLVLRQHTMYYYNYEGNNVKRIPFGFMKKFTSNSDKIEYKDDKKYNWAFIGNIKNKFVKERLDRETMIKNFKNYSNNFFVSENIPYNKVYEIYHDTIFIPSGRNLLSGKINHPFIEEPVYQDNNRIYDAIVSGAIPLVAGEEKEKNICFQDCVPPLIKGKNWEEILEKIKIMNEEDIKNRINIQKEWWIGIKKDIKERIKNLLL